MDIIMMDRTSCHVDIIIIMSMMMNEGRHLKTGQKFIGFWGHVTRLLMLIGGGLLSWDP